MSGPTLHVTPALLAGLRAQWEASQRNDLRAFMRRVVPRFEYPAHLGEFLSVLKRAATEPVEVVVSTPPRHAKTTTTLLALVWLMGLVPGLKVCYVTYGAALSHRKSIEAQRYAREAGLALRAGVEAREHWELENGSTFSATGADGPLTGFGFNLVVVDDPHKDRADAESQVLRQKLWDWFRDVLYTRQEPSGTSFVVIQTRWHPDDLAGKLIADGWQTVNLPAISDAGMPLWGSLWPVDRLRKIEEQVGPYGWASLYQGQPRPRGDSVFGEPSFYDELPKSGYQISIGADFAYTSKTYADFSVAVVLYHAGGVSYVAEVVRERTTIDRFRNVLSTLQARHPGKITAFVAATEEGSVEMLNPRDRTQRINAQAVRAVTDKFTRAQPVAAAWRCGKVLVPRKAPWLDAFLGEVTSFTGVGDDHDDQVDALAGAFHPYAGPIRSRRAFDETGFAFG
jgi:predicted phage terminase large subunit-like protein